MLMSNRITRRENLHKWRIFKYGNSWYAMPPWFIGTPSVICATFEEMLDEWQNYRDEVA